MRRREPGEQLGAEVGGDPERGDVDPELVDDPGELLDLARGVELRLVADDVVDPRTGGEAVDDVVPEVERVVDLDGRGHEAEARGEHRLTRAVELGEDQPLPVAGALVVVDLQGKGRLAAVHRSREEDQIRHGRQP